MGWKTMWEDDEADGPNGGADSKLLYHYGTNFFFNSAQYLDGSAGQGLQVLVASNSGSSMVRLAIKMAIDALLVSIETAAAAAEPAPGPD